MLSARGIRHACPKHPIVSCLSLRRNLCNTSYHQRPKSEWRQAKQLGNRAGLPARQAGPASSSQLRHVSTEAVQESDAEIVERTVRDAKRRFRDTLPKNYLTEVEYALYVRLYGPPLRETTPEDVGIDTHADMSEALREALTRPRGAEDGMGTIIKEMEDGSSKEIRYKLPMREELRQEDQLEREEAAMAAERIQEMEEEALVREEPLQAAERLVPEDSMQEAKILEDDEALLDEEEDLLDEENMTQEEKEELRQAREALEAEEDFVPTEGMTVGNGLTAEQILAAAHDAAAAENATEVDHVAEAEERPDYINAVARNQREYDALQQLAADFARTQREQQVAREEADEEAEELAEDQTKEAAIQAENAASWPREFERRSDDDYYEDDEYDPIQRFHPYTLEGSFHGKQAELLLPMDDLVQPVSELLRRSHSEHVRIAAEDSFGGAGLPLAAETISTRGGGNMNGVGLSASTKQMTEIQADAFMSAYFPAAYASAFSTLKETRKRLGPEWIQSKLKNGGEGLSVLDVGAGGAGILAWEQILQAEWDTLKETGEVKGDSPPGAKSVIVASDRLRGRMKTFLENTTFLPRMPDYEHSGEMKGPRLDGGDRLQPKKSYDVIIASHQLLREKETHRRQAVLNNLWHLLKKDGGVLIILEKAHHRGFEAVAHARHTMLYNFLLPPSGEPRVSPEEFNPTFHRELEPGQIVAPCTNEETCPMYPEPGKSHGRKDFCHFSQRFVRPAFYTKMLGRGAGNHGEVKFSYVSVQRGVSKPVEPSGREATIKAAEGYEKSGTPPDMRTLPRMVLPALKRKGHVTMDMCTPEGKLERWTVPKSFSKLAYHDARKSRWGDLWALGTKTRAPRPVRNGELHDKFKREESSIKKKMRSGKVEKDAARRERLSTRDKQPKSKFMKEYERLRELKAKEEEEVMRIADEIEDEVEAEVEAEEIERKEKALRDAIKRRDG